MARKDESGRHAALRELKTTASIAGAVWREAEWGEMRVGYETYLADFEDSDLLTGLPDDRCPCPHWGFLLSGRMTVHYADHDEVVQAGDVYYMAPGHTMSAVAGTVLIEFSPRDKFEELMEVAERNLARLEDAQEGDAAPEA